MTAMQTIFTPAKRLVALGGMSPGMPPHSAYRLVHGDLAALSGSVGAIGPQDVLLSDLGWMAVLPEPLRADLCSLASAAAAWIVTCPEDAAPASLLAWPGVTQFMSPPRDDDRFLRLLDELLQYDRTAPVRVLIAALAPDDAQAYGQMLANAGMEVRSAADANQACHMLAGFSPDVLLLDAGHGGMAMASLLRWRTGRSGLPALLLGHPGSVPPGSTSADLVLSAPLAPRQLTAAIYAMHGRAQPGTRDCQRELAASVRQDQLRHAVDEHAIVSIADVKGNIVHVNDRFCAISGYSRAELLGNNHRMVKSDLHPPEFYRELWRTIGSGRTWNGEVCNRRANGELYWVEATIVPNLDAHGKPVQYISIRTDITSLKHSEEALRQSEERFSFAVEGAGDGIWDWNMRTGERPVSGHYETMLGYAKGAIEPTIDAWIDSVHPDDQARVRLQLEENQTGRAPGYDMELRLRCSNGAYKWILCRGTVVARDAFGLPTRMIGIHSNIDERKAVEAALVEAREAAERANHAKSAFLSSMSHELRTPMNAILGFSQMLEYSHDLKPEQLDSVREILKAGRHLLELINEVLDLAKIESGKLELSLEPVELAGVIDDCRSLIQPLAAARHINLRIDTAPGLTVQADRVRLKQVLLNLLSNAVKYNRSGGAIVLAASESAAGPIRIAVSDTGAGIAPERLPELFQPFNRLDAGQTEIEGTGIGLTIARRLVEVMDGAIDVASQLGSGTTFTVELPAAQVRPDQADLGLSLPLLATPFEARRYSVLCIDDNPVNLKLVGQMLAIRHDIHLLTAHAPEIGIELAQAHQPDLILLDINMPGMDGYQVLSVLRQSTSLALTPIVAVTANAMPRDIERGQQAGFNAYLSKPIEISTFMHTIQQCLQKKVPKCVP